MAVSMSAITQSGVDPAMEVMTFEQPDGSFTYNVTISTLGSQWTSPEAPLEALTKEVALEEAARKASALHRSLRP